MMALMMSTFSSCAGILEVGTYDDPTVEYYSTYSDYYIDNARGILVVYIDNLPYWQYYNPYNRMWYRSLVPYAYRNDIILNRYRGRSFWDYKFYQDRRHWKPQPRMMRPRPDFNRTNPQGRPHNNPNVRPQNRGTFGGPRMNNNNNRPRGTFQPRSQHK